MKHTRSIGLVVLILALSSVSMALQLSGSTGRTTLQNVANDTFNQTFNARTLESVGEMAGGAVLEKVVNILNQTFNATKMPPENLSIPSGEVLENVTGILNQTFNATTMPPENLSEPAGGAILEMAANDTQNRTSIIPAVSRPNLSGGLGKTILSRLVTNQTINASLSI